MTEAEAQTLQLLQQINQKLDRLLKGLPADAVGTSASATENLPRSRYELAQEIAAMTPPSVRQTNAVELLRADRSR